MERNVENVYVFGAHSRGRTAAEYLSGIEDGVIVKAYLVNNDEPNERELDGIPVWNLKEHPALDTSLPVYIGTRGVSHERITEDLTALGFKDIRPVTVDLDTRLRTEYFKSEFAKEGREFLKIDDLSADVMRDRVDPGHYCIYEVRSAFDKPLEKDSYEKKDYERSIQVGTALTEHVLKECECRDNEGDNISEKNRQLCEITALYWVWKHAKEDLVGLVHYRRHFLLPADWPERMQKNNIDVLLPVPLYLGPSVGENFRFRHVSEDWDIMLEAIRKRSEADYQMALERFSQSMFCPCNMFVMRRGLLNAYCNWLFPILFEVMERVGSRDDTYQNRYPAFMAERLMNLYLYIRRNDIKTVFADKNFLQ